MEREVKEMIKYYKLFDLLNRREMKKTDLLQVISKGTLSKLSKGGIIQTDVIQKICDFLNCQPGDIMENVFDETKPDKDGNIWYSKELRDENTGEDIVATRQTKSPCHRGEQDTDTFTR